jgi:hypothetical protein
MVLERIVAWTRELTFTEAVNLVICICAVIGLIQFALWIEELNIIFALRER